MNEHALPTIAHVLHRLYFAGAEVLAADLARRLRGQFRFVFFCLDSVGPMGELLRSEGFDVFDLARKPGIDRAVGRRMRAMAKEHRVALFHAHQYTPFFYAALSRGLLSSRADAPILFTEHGRHYPDHRSWKRVLANRFLLRRHDRVTAVGQFVKTALVNNEGIPAPRIEVVRNGIDPALFEAVSPTVRREVRAELGIRDNQPVVLQVARFHPVKDHATALRAMAETLKSLPDALFILAGDGELRSALEAQAAQLGIASSVRFLGVRRDVPRLMAAADVFILSSLSEGISVTLLEAMGCELPIAATDVGGNGEVVADHQTGLLSPRSDATKLSANLVTLLRDSELRRRMGSAGRKRLLEHFTQAQMHARYASIYSEMTAV
ncbi:MAG: glycosyltransferase [Phycisphaeraceae bacterium]|nr:glycosyltransferase [Phycisphaeraceae bacterium]